MRIKFYYTLICLLTCFFTGAQQIITKVAGTGVYAYSGDGGPAFNAGIVNVGHMTFVNGSMYFGDASNHVIRKIDAAGIITTVAGTGISGYSGDGGPASAAQINFPDHLTSDNAGNIYFLDQNYRVIRKIDVAGNISTIGGTTAPGFSGDGGPVALAQWANNIVALVSDGAGNLYISDGGNHRIRKISTAGIITTYAGNGTMAIGPVGDGGPAINAPMGNPFGLEVDNAGNLYIYELGNHYIWKVNTAGIITRVAGNGITGFAGDGGPALNAALAGYNIAIDDAGNIYDLDVARVRVIMTNGIITTWAGTGNIGYSGDGGPAINADIATFQAEIGPDGALYLGNIPAFAYIRKITCNGSTITQQPRDTTICTTADPQFSVTVTGTPLLQWQVNTGAGWNDITNDITYSGATSNTLTITGANAAMNGYQYRCRVYNPCSDQLTAVRTLTVAAPSAPTISVNASATTICTGTNVTFNSTINFGGSAPIYQWRKNGVNVGTNSPAYSDNGLNNGDIISCALTSNFPCATIPTVASNDITITVTTVVAPAININPSATTICAGTNVVFTANANNGGPTPVYEWRKNGVLVGANAATYNDNALINTDAINCTLISSSACASPTTAVSNTVVMTVNPNLTPAITINTVNTTVCTGTMTNFTSTINNGGPAPVYQWKKNGVNVGANSPAYADNGLINGDIITCELSSNAACASPVTIASNTITMTVRAPVTPAITIAESANNICSGTNVIFSAVAAYPGDHPIYQWKKNGVNVGSNQLVYFDNTLNNGDVISLELTSDAFCITTNFAVSNAIMMNVIPTVTPTVTINASANSVCAGTSVTFTMNTTNDGGAPLYTWFKNATNLFLNSPTYTDNTLVDGDIVFGVMESSAPCATSSVVVSNWITMDINPLVTPGITISTPDNNICQGTAANFTAALSFTDNAAVYQWQKNGVPVGNNSPTHTDNTVVSGDIISCMVIPNISCLTAPSANSNTIAMTVNANPDITLDQTPTLCTGSTRILDAGAFASYLWNDGSTGQTLTVSGPGTYTVIVTDNNGCQDADGTVISTMLPAPDNFLADTASFCRFDSLILISAGTYTSYTWNNGSASPSIIVKHPGVYTLDVTDNNGCNGRNTILVSMRECLKGFYIPTAFTPNGDGKNDFFQPLIFGDVKNYDFRVFDRWGTLLFQTKDISRRWDGIFKGKRLDQGVFVWMCVYQLEGETMKEKKGTVTLIR